MQTLVRVVAVDTVEARVFAGENLIPLFVVLNETVAGRDGCHASADMALATRLVRAIDQHTIVPGCGHMGLAAAMAFFTLNSG